MAYYSLGIWRFGVGFFRHSFFGLEPITDAADRLEIIGRAADFFPQPSHVSIDGATIDRVLVTPNILQQPVAGLHASATPREDFEQLEFRRRQDHGLIGDFH